MKKSHRKYRIKSKFRFITFLVIVLGLAIGAFGYITGFDISTALSEPVDQITIEVAYGDTIWDIADRFKSSDNDIRKAVYELCTYNNIEDGQVEEGTKLNIPETL